MRREDLLNYIGDVDAKYVEELFEETPAVVGVRVRRMRNIRAIAASLAIIILGTVGMFVGFGGSGFTSVAISGHSDKINSADNTVIMLDVNPSFRFEINDRDCVVDFKAINTEAKALESEMKVLGKTYDKALEHMLKVLNANGYISKDKNSLLISVLDKDEGKASAVRKNAVKAADSFGHSESLALSILSQVMTDDSDCLELASKYGVSSGKIAFVEKICDANKTSKKLKVEYIANSSVQLLNQLINYVDAPQGVEFHGKAAGVAPSDVLDKLNIADMSGEEIVKFAGDVATYDWDTPGQVYNNIESILGAISPKR